jgi:putative ABC transport system permease protein
MSIVLEERPAAPPAPVGAAEEAGPYAILESELPRRHGSRLAQSLPSALQALRANEGRAVLTALGIIIGVASVIVMVSIGQGASAQVSDRLAGLGTNVLTIMPGSSQSGGVQSGAGSVSTLKVEDADAIASQVSGVARLSPVVNGNSQVIAGGQNWQVAEGSFFTAQDESEARSVAVIGQTVARNLFPSGQNPLGQLIRIRNVPVTVVGVLASKGATGFQDQDDVILIPFKTGQVRLFGSSALNSIQVQAAQADQMDAVTQDIDQLLRQRHKLQSGQANDFSVRSSNDILQTAQGVSQTLTLLLSGVAAVSLIVGGIGIMNIMLVSVTERTRETGIRIAIGARPGDVLSQFLVEAVLLSVLGGLIGVGLGVGLSFLAPRLAGWPTALSYSAMGIAFGFAALVGVFFGFYPARKASGLNPIDALRSE